LVASSTLPAMRPLLLAAALVAPFSLFAQEKELTLLDYHVTAPSAWQPRTPSSSSRLAEFVLPQTTAGAGEIVVYFFGPQQQPNVDANLTRWKGQFSHPDGSPVSEKVTRDSSGAFPLVFAEYEGDYRRGIGAGSADSVRASQRLVAAIVPTPKGTMYIQMFGAAARVEAERTAFFTFVKGIR
jgi:hypothetical protein